MKRTIPLAERFWAKVIKRRGCGGWCGAKSERGYGLIGKGRRGEGVAKAHRVSWELHYGPIPKGFEVAHTCNTQECCKPKHLYLATHLKNMKDAKRDGLMGGNEGENNGANSRLTTRQALRLRGPLKHGELTKLAKKFRITIDHASRIHNGKKWSHLNAAT